MSNWKKLSIIILAIILLTQLVWVVFKPVFSQGFIDFSKKHSRGRFVCTLDNEGRHVGKLYKLDNGEKKLVHKSVSNSCIFSRPKVNAGFFVFAIGGGGGATPFESGNSGQIVSKHFWIKKPVIVIKIGKGGRGTFMDESDKFVDAKDGESTTIDDLSVTAQGGSKSTRMTPLGGAVHALTYHIPEKYHLLYGISKSEKFGSGGKFDLKTKDTSAKAQSGHSGAVIIQW